tara:strand:+ start:1275 stop:1406 length:132 start_codon:yes stop_codon:yes gene_type:complete
MTKQGLFLQELWQSMKKTVGPNHPTTVTFRRNLEKLKRQQKSR